MQFSQNGYPANDSSLLEVIRPVAARAFRVRKGAVASVFSYLIAEFDKRVEDIEAGQLDDWSYAERPVRGGSDLSNHASGTAVDLNATQHPLGTAPASHFSEAQMGTIFTILNELGGVVRWGGSYTGRQDPMHFEINAPESRVAQVAAGLHSPAPQEEDDLPYTPAQLRAFSEEGAIRAAGLAVSGRSNAETDAAEIAGWKGYTLPEQLEALEGRQAAKLAALETRLNAKLASLSVVGGATVNLDALAAKVAVELARRLQA